MNRQFTSKITTLLIFSTLFLFSFFFQQSTVLALTAEEISVMSAKALHSNNEEITSAFQLLKSKNILKVDSTRPWELSDLYSRNSNPEIADAIILLQEAEIIDATPVNWEGSNNACELLLEASEIYPRAIEMIDRAERTVRFNIFLFGGKVGDNTIAAFKRAKARGVSVHIITTPPSENNNVLSHLQSISNKVSGSEPLPPYRPVIKEAIKAGISVGYYPIEWLNGKAVVKADHNKMLSIDGMEAMIGGMNFADCIAGNHDLMMWLKGPAVTELDEIFNDNWRARKKEDALEQEATHLWHMTDDVLDAATALPARDYAKVTVAYSNAFKNATRQMVEKLIDEAEKKIRIMMFTFTDDVIVDKVIEAHKRGVDVKVILDPNVHAFGLRMMGAPNISTVRAFKKAGIEVKAYKTAPGFQMHIKAAMIDDIHTMYGSTNWTTGGFDANNETFVNITSEEVAEDFQALFDLDWDDYSYVSESEGAGKWLISTVAELLDWGF